MQEEIINYINKYEKVALLGFGREGRSTYNFIRKYLKEKKLYILDKNEIYIDDEYTLIISGDDYLSNLDSYDLIIKSPGIILKDLNMTSNTKNKITSQLELLLKVYRDNIIGITGTKGKSTTSSLIYSVLKDQNKDTYLVGNIGVPVFDEIDNYKSDSIIVIEMSSHQLEYIDISPKIGIILNLYEDHLDHTGTLENYHNAKMNIIRYQNSNDIAICNIDNKYLKDKLNKEDIKSKLIGISFINDAYTCIKDDNIYINDKLLINKNRLKRQLLGDHNLMNILFIIALSDILSLNINKTLNTIKNFKPIEHRMEYVGKYQNIDFYNDSIATIPEATIEACKTLKRVNTLIIGGEDRGINYDLLTNYIINSDIENIICMPTTGYKLSDIIKTDKNNIHKTENLEEAVNIAFKVTKKNQICLLSPAAPSYEYFKNFEEKGNKYKEYIKKH